MIHVVMDQEAPGAGFGLDLPDARHLGELFLGLAGQGPVSLNLGDLETHPARQGMGYSEALEFHSLLREGQLPGLTSDVTTASAVAVASRSDWTSAIRSLICSPASAANSLAMSDKVR